MSDTIEETQATEEEVIDEPILPSDEVKEQTLDDFIASNTSENGKLFGQFDNVESALEHYRKQEITHTNNMRELKNAEKIKQEEAQSVQAEIETTRVQQETIESLIPEFIENGMSLNDDMMAKLKESGLDENLVKVKAYEIRDKANEVQSVAYGVTGGDKEEYSNMITWAKDVLTPEEMQSFDVSLQSMASGSNVGLLAIEGLYGRYKNRDNVDSKDMQPIRLQGSSPKEPSLKGYSSFDELVADRRASRNNPKLREQYLKKLNETDDRILTLG